ncbi:hypothetical protein HOLleu_17043 [Holothuria leucospilota]|uniref:Uncharacterized protein n=1 Tax=Holothuria leucospilota TaxID=206669 RepID=A0A9Q1C633_HOLLE|nr:hypothetical protein HOLleu_17043 [Holothuria leucospilota]
MEAENWDIIIDCLFESEDEANFKAIHSELCPFTKEFSVNIKNMDQHYHRMAVTKFCKYLTKNKIPLSSLTFWKSCKLEDFSQLQIHSVNFLAFIEIDFKDESDFTFFVQRACRLNVLKSVQFVKCQCPEKVSKPANRDILTNLRTTSSRTPEILRAETVPEGQEDTGVKWYQLILCKGCWILPK